MSQASNICFNDTRTSCLINSYCLVLRTGQHFIIPHLHLDDNATEDAALSWVVWREKKLDVANNCNGTKESWFRKLDIKQDHQKYVYKYICLWINLSIDRSMGFWMGQVWWAEVTQKKMCDSSFPTKLLFLLIKFRFSEGCHLKLEDKPASSCPSAQHSAPS